MNITTIDWEDMYNKLKLKDGSSRLYTLDSLVPQHINAVWDKLYQVLASVEPIKIDDQYSPSATLKSIPDEINTPYGTIDKKNFRYLILTLSDIPRSVILKGKAKEHPQWSQLVPLWLAAYKHYKNISYNSWIRDSDMEFMLGKSLYDDINNVPDDFVFDIDKLAELRHKALSTATKTWPLDCPIQKQTDLGNGFIVKKNNAVGAMILQIWLANVQVRHEDMILDYKDWDIMPTPYDAKLEQMNISRSRTSTEERRMPF